MDSKILKLIEMFDIEADVEHFVKEKVKELVSEKHTFSFSGSNHAYACDIKEPHAPHIIGQYNTVRYGMLDNFCLGRSGETPAGELVIVTEKYSSGSPEYPSRAKGYWFIKEKEE